MSSSERRSVVRVGRVGRVGRPGRLLVSALVVACLAAPGCSGKKDEGEARGSGASSRPAGDCKAVAGRLIELVSGAREGLGERQEKLLLAQQGLLREETEKTCARDEWSDEVRACMMAAADLHAFNQCTASVRAARGLPPPTTGAPAAPALPSATPSSTPPSSAPGD